MSKEKLKPIYWLRNYLSKSYSNQQNKFLGQVLTIIDASISDKEQRKGIKDLIQDKFYDRKGSMILEEILLDYCKKYCPDTLPDENKEPEFIKRYEEPNNPDADNWDFEK